MQSFKFIAEAPADKGIAAMPLFASAC